MDWTSERGLALIERRESSVRSYSRSYPVVFVRGEGAELIDAEGRRYIDFFCGAGALNHGHDDPTLRQALLDYIGRNGVTHTLDMATEAKCGFLEAFERRVLAPRGLPHRVMFTGPTGTNAVEASLKLARKVTGRSSVIAFTQAFHGMTLGSLALTAFRTERAGAGAPLRDVTRMPFEGYLGPDVDTLDLLERALQDSSSGVDLPAAVILETVQAEGGVNVASVPWLQRLRRVTRDHGVLLIVDEIQTGCGRTGPYFSFERAGLEPDLVLLSKAISGAGLPMSIVLIRPELDLWKPGEHNGTFRGNNLAFVTARAALERYWSDDALSRAVAARARLVAERLAAMGAPWGGRQRGLGLMQGLDLSGTPGLAKATSREAFKRGLIVEAVGGDAHVVKLLPALTIDDDTLTRGLDILEASLRAVGG